MVKVKNAGTENWEGGRWGTFCESIWDYIMCASMEEGDVVFLV